MKDKKECKHRWRVGGFAGIIKSNKIKSEGIYIWCEYCNKKIKAYYHSKFYNNFLKRKKI